MADIILTFELLVQCKLIPLRTVDNAAYYGIIAKVVVFIKYTI